jgi:GT2 family glycosyltransferase
MKTKLYSIYKKLPVPLRSCCKILQRILVCFKRQQGFESIRTFGNVFCEQSKLFVDAFYQKTEELNSGSDKLVRLHNQTKGLHELMSYDNQFSYSILIPLDNPQLSYFRETLESVLQLTPPKIEILFGYKANESKETLEILYEFEKQIDNKIKSFEISDSEIVEVLASKAKGNMLFIMGQEDLVRCDILYRYEQMLRMQTTKNVVMYCQEYHIQDESKIQNKSINFPYVFSTQSHRSFLIPKDMWALVENKNDFVAQLDHLGMSFFCIPHPLYGYRNEGQERSLNHLQEYYKQKDLDWHIEEGYSKNTWRVIPALKEIPKVHVIIPFKEQKNLTINAVNSILAQKGVQIYVTTVDNGSEDRSIGLEIQRLGAEVLFTDAPFNYSFLNNYALKNSHGGDEFNLVLFLNNDVELKEDALLEMCRWIVQPGIGIVGCRLNYPNGLLQHGGVRLDIESPASKWIWEHTEKGMNFSDLKMANELGVVDSVTAACALMKKSAFFEVGGFDEIWYPIRYSDITLTEKIKALGYHCFYTPYAFGVHHESISRKYENIEDIESSSWFYQQWKKFRKEPHGQKFR